MGEEHRFKMKNHESDDIVKEKQIVDIITRKAKQLSEAERDLLEHGSTCNGLNAALCGLIAKSFLVHLKCDTDLYS